MNTDQAYINFFVKGIESIAEEKGEDVWSVTSQEFADKYFKGGKVMGVWPETISGKLNSLGGFLKLRNAHFGVKVAPQKLVIESKNKQNKQIATSEARSALVLESLSDMVNKLKPLTYHGKTPKKKKVLDRHHHLLISDTHFGSDLSTKRGCRQYGIREEARSFSKVVLDTADYKPQYHDSSQLWLNISGDIIQGDIHDVQNYANISQQCARAINIFTNGIDFLTHSYPQININFISGNHDRISGRHKERAMQGKEDSWAYIIGYSLKKYFSKYPNVNFNLPHQSWFTYKSFDANYFGTHGDTHLKIPFPSGVINVRAIEAEINKLNSRQNSPRYAVVMAGHVHTAMQIRLSNGVILMTNPPLIPTDEFGLSINIDPDAPTGQWIFESVEGHPVGDSRVISVSEKDRQNGSLDDIIDVSDLE